MNEITTIKIKQPDDWHLHVRDGDVLKYVLPATVRQFRRAIIMPNLKPPVTTAEMAIAYRQRILDALAAAADHGDVGITSDMIAKFEPLMVLYLTGATSAADIEKAKASSVVHAVKLYPAGATTNSDAGVSDLLRQCEHTLSAMQECDMPLLVHGEVTDLSVDVFDREAEFIERVMKPLRDRFPSLRVVFEHITTKQAADYVRSEGGQDAAGREYLAATVTPQHLLYNRNALFQGGLQPHWYCLPVLKREEHRLALVDAVTSRSSRFFLGTDSAPHAKHLKEMACGCAGCYSAPFAIQMYAEVFDKANALDQLENFASVNGPAFYGLPVNDSHLTLAKQATQIPKSLPFSAESGIVPFRAGDTLEWSLLD